MRFLTHSFLLLFLTVIGVSAQPRHVDPDGLDASEKSVSVSLRPRYSNEREDTQVSGRGENPYTPAPGSRKPADLDDPQGIGPVPQRTIATLTVYDGVREGTIEQKFVSARISVSTAKHLKGLTTGDGDVDSYILASSDRYNIDPVLIYAQMGQESGYRHRAISPKGAAGLMQLMPATARRLGVTNIYDPRQNIEGGVKYMRILLDMFDGDLALALAGYNAGEGAVIKYGYKIPPYAETRDYVKRISQRYRSLSRSSNAR